MSGYLLNYIQEVKDQSTKHVLERTWFQKLLKVPPMDMTQLKGAPIFHKDPGQNFISIFMARFDFELVYIMICLFVVFDRADLHLLTSMLIIYTWEKLLTWFRQWTGTRNLARKTLVDDRFLL